MVRTNKLCHPLYPHIGSNPIIGTIIMIEQPLLCYLTRSLFARVKRCGKMVQQCCCTFRSYKPASETYSEPSGFHPKKGCICTGIKIRISTRPAVDLPCVGACILVQFTFCVTIVGIQPSVKDAVVSFTFWSSIRFFNVRNAVLVTCAIKNRLNNGSDIKVP